MNLIHRRVREFLGRRWQIGLLLVFIFLVHTQLYIQSIHTVLESFDANLCPSYVDQLKSGKLEYNSIESSRETIQIKNLRLIDVNITTVAHYRPLLNCLDQEDPFLHRTIKDHYLFKGNVSKRRLSFKYDQLVEVPQVADLLDKVFKTEEKGVFIECGSYDAEFHSISLPFEIERGWTGLLIEANPADHYLGRLRSRDAYYMNACLGLKTTPHFASLKFHPRIIINPTTVGITMAGLSESIDEGEGVEIQCFPLYSIIEAAGFPTVNLLILDVEGAELAVLKTLPWDKVDIQVMTVETDIIGKIGTKELFGGSQNEARKYIISKGYTLYQHSYNFNNLTGLQNNDLFIRNDLVNVLKPDLPQIKL